MVFSWLTYRRCETDGLFPPLWKLNVANFPPLCSAWPQSTSGVAFGAIFHLFVVVPSSNKLHPVLESLLYGVMRLFQRVLCSVDSFRVFGCEILSVKADLSETLVTADKMKRYILVEETNGH